MVDANFKSTKVKLTDYDIMQTLGTGLLKLKILILFLGSFGRVRLAK